MEQWDDNSDYWQACLDPIETPPRPWLDQAVCTGMAPEDGTKEPHPFYPGKGHGATREAMIICRICPVRLDCLQFAIDTGDRHGILGGIPEVNRRRWMNEKISAEEMIRTQDLETVE